MTTGLGSIWGAGGTFSFPSCQMLYCFSFSVPYSVAYLNRHSRCRVWYLKHGVWNLKQWLNAFFNGTCCALCMLHVDLPVPRYQFAKEHTWHVCSNGASAVPRDQLPEAWDRTKSSAFRHACRCCDAGGPGPPFEKVKEGLHRQRAGPSPSGLEDVGELAPPFPWARAALATTGTGAASWGAVDHTGEMCTGEVHGGSGGQQPPLQPHMEKPWAVNFSSSILYIPCPRLLEELIELKSFPSAYSI